MPESNGQQIEKDFKETPQQPQPLSFDEQNQLTFIVNRANKSKIQLEQKIHELNGLDFLTDDQYNRDIRNSFIRPKKNDQEVRINTGTVEKKMITVVNEILSLNLTPEVNTFDEQNKPLQELGNTFTHLISKTETQVNDEDIDFAALWDLATRRMMMFEEYQEEKEVVDKRKIKYDLEKGEIEFKTKKYKVSRPRRRLRDPRSVLLGDYRIPNHNYDDQPYIIVYDRMHWRRAFSIYGNYKKWQYVKAGMPLDGVGWFGGLFNWRLFPGLSDDEVEVIFYYSYPDDEFQIIINGVPMLAPSTPLPWEHEGYRIKAFVYREMEQDLAFGQLFTINSRVLAGVSDEMLRLIVRKWQQAIEPPTATKGKKVLSRDIWNAGANVSGIGKDEIQKLIDNPGVTASEMSTFEMISNKLEAEIGVSKLFQGLTDRKLTASQAMDQMKQAIKSIGLLVLSWNKVKRDMAYLRIYNIIENNTEPVDVTFEDGELKKIYRFYSIDKAQLEDNLIGTMAIQFADKDLTDEEVAKLKEYEDSEEKKGNIIRFKQINVLKLREFRLNWFVSVIPKEKESSALQKIMFTDEINQAKAISDITGIRLNAATIISDYERIHKKKNVFEKIPSQAPVGQGEGMVDPSNIPIGAAEAAGSAGPEMGGMNDQVIAKLSNSIKREGVNSAT